MTSLEQNSTISREKLQNFTLEIARNAMRLPMLMIIKQSTSWQTIAFDKQDTMAVFYDGFRNCRIKQP